jgi:hypothetical protein
MISISWDVQSKKERIMSDLDDLANDGTWTDEDFDPTKSCMPIIASKLKETCDCLKIDKDGDLIFKTDDKSFLLIRHQNDPCYFLMVFPSVYSFADHDKGMIRIIANRVMGKVKGVKVKLASNRVHMELQVFHSKEEEFLAMFDRYLVPAE